MRTLLAFILLPLVPSVALAQTPRRIDFNREVRPILSDACFACHGPDKAKRKAGLHLDTEEGARADLGGHFALVPGKPKESVLLQRVLSTDLTKRMPPPPFAQALKPEQIDILTQWIDQGAPWQQHWAFIPPQRPALPPVKDKQWPRAGLDYFVLARLEKEGLQPAPEADPITWLRRVSLDLTGLAPMPEEVDSYLQAVQHDPKVAMDKAVDRLLASPRYGERMAMRWLDGARYADTNGYQTDGDRVMWRWRDWVIEAFNNNMPFDQFTIEQLAGDLLPNPTLEQKIATGFNRNHRGNSEGGVIPEEYAVEYVVDRVDTTATVWLGLTMGCARCHNHKYDPLTMKEFYQLFAYFNNVPERGKAIKYGNSPPYVKSPTRTQEVRWQFLKDQFRSAQRVLDHLEPTIAAHQERWEKSPVLGDYPVLGPTPRGQTAFLSMGMFLQKGEKAPDWLDEMPAVGHGNPQVIRGRLGQAIQFDGKSHLDAGDIGAFSFFDRFTLSAWIKPAATVANASGSEGGPIFSRMVDAERADGYNVTIEDGKVHVHLVKRWLDDAIRVETVQRVRPDQWQHLTVSYDGSRLAAGVQIYLDGQPLQIKVNLDDLNQSFSTTERFRIGKGGGRYFHGAIDEVRLFNRSLPPEDVAFLSTLEPLSDIARIPTAQRTPTQARRLRQTYLERAATSTEKHANQSLQDAGDELAVFEDALPTTMVMQEMPTPRPTHLLLRGEYDKPGDRIFPALPAVFQRTPVNSTQPVSPTRQRGNPPLAPTRLDLARWLVSRDNPLTARVAVNRHWQMLFGAGIVKTVEDFGAQGEWPSNPDLLDWLALEFMAPTPLPFPLRGEGQGVRGEHPDPIPWDTKRLLKTLVTSATYRQSSRASKDLVQRDPDNRLLARGPRLRLPAETIRDQALLASGLLVERLGGPSVRPYQPAGLVKELHGTEDFVQDHGANLYRRSLYTFWKRTVAPPALMTFDAANRETCVVREARTNTPLQALNLLNDVTYVEAARVLAQRVLREKTDPDERLTRLFRLAACRSPRPVEMDILRAALRDHQARYAANPAAAHALATAGEAPRDPNLRDTVVAAYTAVANMVLNLDEVISKE